ncbi:MAG: penicillin-insensitive murein endopeptidase [Bdellovibrionales bacterium]|nr:penicillin-insensitive murein endopeptidase [Bdellovibrionales bacterium]
MLVILIASCGSQGGYQADTHEKPEMFHPNTKPDREREYQHEMVYTDSRKKEENGVINRITVQSHRNYGSGIEVRFDASIRGRLIPILMTGQINSNGIAVLKQKVALGLPEIFTARSFCLEPEDCDHIVVDLFFNDSNGKAKRVQFESYTSPTDSQADAIDEISRPAPTVQIDDEDESVSNRPPRPKKPNDDEPTPTIHEDDVFVEPYEENYDVESGEYQGFSASEIPELKSLISPYSREVDLIVAEIPEMEIEKYRADLRVRPLPPIAIPKLDDVLLPATSTSTSSTTSTQPKSSSKPQQPSKPAPTPTPQAPKPDPKKQPKPTTPPEVAVPNSPVSVWNERDRRDRMEMIGNYEMGQFPDFYVYLKQLGRPDLQAIGAPGTGRIVNAEKLGRDMDELRFAWLDANEVNKWGTSYGASFLEFASVKFEEIYPDSPIVINQFSRKLGGRSGGGSTRSHKTGLDLDLAYPAKGNPFPFQDVIDRRAGKVKSGYEIIERTYAMLSLMNESHIVNRFYVDSKVKAELIQFAKDNGEFDDESDLFGRICSLSGHHHHVHVNLWCPPNNRGCVNWDTPNKDNCR